MERYDGDLIVRFEFDGDYSSADTYDGELLVNTELDGDFESSNTFDGQSSEYQIVSGSDTYTGSYQFTPSNQQQTINIANKTATRNITIDPIPSNYGRISYNGAYLTVE